MMNKSHHSSVKAMVALIYFSKPILTFATFHNKGRDLCDTEKVCLPCVIRVYPNGI